MASSAGWTTCSTTGPATARGRARRWEREAWRWWTGCCARPCRCIGSCGVASRTTVPHSSTPAARSHASSTAGGRCARWRWWGRPAAASRCSPPNGRDGWPPRAIGPCWCASTSGWRRRCSATWPMPRRLPGLPSPPSIGSASCWAAGPARCPRGPRRSRPSGGTRRCPMRSMPPSAPIPMPATTPSSWMRARTSRSVGWSR